jgi:iron complex outermembrane recepter protein
MFPGYPAANPQGIIFNDNNPNVLKQSAVFGELSYKLTDTLKLTAGVRYFKFQEGNHSQSCGLGTETGNATCETGAASATGTGVLPKLNLSYTPTSDLNLYTTASKGSRPGGVNLPTPLPTTAQLEANPGAYNCGLPLANRLNPSLPIPPGFSYVTSEPYTYGPDSVWSFEVGEKARTADQRFTINSDVYYIKWQNIQQYLALTCGYPYNANVGEAKSYGPELETSARLVEGLVLSASGAYTQAYISSPTAQSAIAPGRGILNVPKYTYALSLEYQQKVSDDLLGLFRISDAYVGPSQDEAYPPAITLPGYTLVDVRAGVSKGPWAAYLFGTNVTNTRAELTINNTTFAWQTPGITRVTTNQPRTVGLNFEYKF